MSRVILEMERRPVTRAFRKNLPKNRRLWFYGATALISFTVFVIFWCTNIFRDTILSTLELRNGTSTFNFWQRPPVTLIYRIYVFNYTNVQEFESGQANKLRVEEIGPYVYREQLHRVNVVMHKNNTVTYQEKRSFQWESGRTDDEIVSVPNIPLMAALAFSRDMNFVAQIGLTAILSTIQAKPFIEVPAGGYIWGYDDKIFQLAKPFISLKQTLPFEKFGVLASKKGVNHDRITMHTGQGDHHQLGMIQLINGMDDRKIWGDKECDSVYGTDGSMFPPEMVLDRNNTLYVYAKDICRKVPFRFDSRAIVSGIPIYRYKPPSDMFTSTRTKNSCYCSTPFEKDSEEVYDTKVCPPAGIYNISQCSFGFPLVISFPHFYLGEASLFKHVDGLKPEAERHQTYLDMHPRLSIPISGWSRFQLNVDVRGSNGVPLSGKLKDGTILPLMWIEAGIEDIPAQIKLTLHRAHYMASAIEACCQWFSLIAVFLFIFAFISTLKKDKEVKHMHIPTVDTVEQTKLPE